MGEWDGVERLKDRWKQQAALETGTGAETVVNCSRNCKGRTKFLRTFFLGFSVYRWRFGKRIWDGNSVPVAGLYRASASNKSDLLCSRAIC